ncbi:MAG: hypothetical protein HY076_09045 [Candidatus Eisenbacteria bacterium]|uniref:S9 family peptidase n=1 Tax=Eiseniibacteriota bacterium TaxID=2212470 RepID=A0A9D6LCY0_UNCEI|nr:hypothetical protein [Candidatus Eisenbacteria bacterium]
MSPRALIPLAAALLLASGIAAAAPAAPDVPVYRTPPKVVADVLTAPRIPRGAPSISPDGARMLLADQPSLIPITTLAEPVEKLAGLEILPAMRANRAALKGASSGFSIVTIADGAKLRAKLPDGARLGGAVWSPTSDRIACALFAAGGSELWIVDAATGAARRFEGVRLNTVLGAGIEWMPDGKSLMCATLPAGAGDLPATSRVPRGPQVRIGAGRPTPQRTTRDVLRTSEDQERFSAYVQTQFARVPADGGAAAPVGAPGLYLAWSLAPDGAHLVVDRLAGAPALGFPVFLFPRTVEIWGADGALVAKVGDVPLNDRSAISSVAPLGPRDPTWSPDGRALWFFSWQDTPGADAMKAIKDTTLAQPGTDRLMRLDAPFTSPAAVVATSDFRLRGIGWVGGGTKLVVDDVYEPRRRMRMWWIDPAQPAHRTMLVDRSTEGVYDDPGPAAHASRPPRGAALVHRRRQGDLPRRRRIPRRWPAPVPRSHGPRERQDHAALRERCRSSRAGARAALGRRQAFRDLAPVEPRGAQLLPADGRREARREAERLH